MTDQAHDALLYHDRTYLIAGLAGYKFFTPASHGLVVSDDATGNWRGWHAIFTVNVVEKLLRLSRAELLLEPGKYERADPPRLFGVSVRNIDSFPGVSYCFDASPPLIPFTGGLLIDEVLGDWQPSLYFGGVELMYHRNIREMVFQDGLLLEEIDRTGIVSVHERNVDISKGRWKRMRELDDAAQNRLAFRYEDVRSARNI